MPLSSANQVLAKWTSNGGTEGIAGGSKPRSIDTTFSTNVSNLTAGAGLTITSNPARWAVDLGGLNSATLAVAKTNNDYIDVSFKTLAKYGDISQIAFGVMDIGGKGFGYSEALELSNNGFATAVRPW